MGSAHRSRFRRRALLRSAIVAAIGSEELAASITPIMGYCIEQFGPDRCMFESNFPVDKVSFSHHVLFDGFRRFCKSYSGSERAPLFPARPSAPIAISDMK